MNKYSIYCKHVNGMASYLSFRNRTTWGIRTTRKHLRDCVRMKAEGKLSHVEFFSIVLT